MNCDDTDPPFLRLYIIQFVQDAKVPEMTCGNFGGANVETKSRKLSMT